MIKAARPGARRLALLVVVVGVAGGIALGIIGCVQGLGDVDKHGRLSLPGEELLDLPKGEIALYYEERVTLGENESLDAPRGIRVVATRENERVKSEKLGVGNAVNLDNRSYDEWGKIEIPRAGKWRVVARSEDGGSNTPAVTLGRSQTDNFMQAGITIGALGGGGLLLAGLILLFGRIGYTPPTPQQLAASMPRVAATPAPASFGQAPPQPQPQPPAPGYAGPGDPVEAQLRDLERRHAAGEFGDQEYQKRRQAVLHSAFRPPGAPGA